MKGEVVVASLTDNPRRFIPGRRLFARLDDEVFRLVVEKARRTDKGVIVKFDGIDDRSSAARMDKAVLEVPEAEAERLAPGEFWVDDIIGIEVETSGGEPLGKVTGIMKTGVNDVYVVTGPKGEVLIPAIKDVVRSIDTDRRKMVIEPLPGMIGS